MGRCSFCENYEGSKNLYAEGFCDLRQIPVMSGRTSDDCSYYREAPTFDDDDDDNDDYDW